MQKGQNDCKILRSKEPVKDIIRGKKSAENNKVFPWKRKTLTRTSLNNK